MTWSTDSIKRERRRGQGAVTTDTRGIPATNQFSHKLKQRKRYSDNNTDIRYGIRLSDGTSVMSEMTVNEIREADLKATQDNLRNHLFDKADRLRRMREAAAAQGALDLPDHW